MKPSWFPQDTKRTLWARLPRSQYSELNDQNQGWAAFVKNTWKQFSPMMLKCWACRPWTPSTEIKTSKKAAWWAFSAASWWKRPRTAKAVRSGATEIKFSPKRSEDSLRDRRSNPWVHKADLFSPSTWHHVSYIVYIYIYIHTYYISICLSSGCGDWIRCPLNTFRSSVSLDFVGA